MKVLEARNIRREDFDAEKIQGMTFSTWALRYLELVKAKKSCDRDRQHCKHLNEFFRPLLLSEITRARIMEYKNARLSSPIVRHGKSVVDGKTVKVSTVNRELSCLRHMLHLAADEGLIESVPRMKLDSEKHLARERVLTEHEEASLLEKSPHWLQRVIVGAIETAMDRSDLLRLTRDEVKRKEGIIKLTGGRTKTGVKAIIPVSPRLEAVLSEIWEERRKVSNVGNLVFTDSGKVIAVPKLRKAFEKAVADAGIEDFRFKDLRHTAKTKWAKMGVPVEAAMVAAGHKSVAMHYRYVNLNEHHVKEAFKMATQWQHEKEAAIDESVTA